MYCTSVAAEPETVQPELIFGKQNSAPKYFARGSQQRGLCDLIYDSLKSRLAQKQQRVRIDPNLYPIKRVLAMVLAGDVHVFCGAGRNKKRETLYSYSLHPVYQPSNVLAMHKDDPYIAHDYVALQKDQLKIGAFFGASSTTYLKTFRGIQVVDHFTQLEDGLNAVARKKIPYFYYHDLGLSYLVNRSSLPIKLMPTKFRTYSHWLLYSLEMTKIQIELLDSSLEEMINDGELDRIREPFFKY